MSKIETTTLSPSATDGALMAAAMAEIPLFLWGPPGVGKSSIAQQVANRLGIAFIDVRLSQMDPTDVRGMPYKIEENGETVGVDWAPPLIFPKNIKKFIVRDIDATETPISFERLNPVGSNGIHYVRDITIAAKALNPAHTAKIIEQSLTEVIVALLDADGNLVPGKIRLDIKGEAHGIIAYEEMNSAPPSVLAACYQLILDRRVGNYILPKGVQQFAMGNRETDKGVSFKMPTPLSNRFDHLELKPDFDDWQTWAVGARVSSDVVGFLSAFPHSMFQFNPGTAARGFATPRSWTMVSKLLKALETSSIQVTEEQLAAMIYGAVGDGVGAEFFEFRKIASALPNPRDILSGRVKDLPIVKDKDKTGLSYALTTSLLYFLRESHEKLDAKGILDNSKNKEREEWYGLVDNYIEFALKNFKAEVNVMGIRSALQTHGLPISGLRCKQWSTFVKKYRSVMIDS